MNRPHFRTLTCLALLHAALSACAAPMDEPTIEPGVGGQGGQDGHDGHGGEAPAPPVTADECASCAPGARCCRDRCIDVADDPQNCGACGNECVDTGGRALCIEGQCSIACDAEHLDCDGQADNGCEAEDPGPPPAVTLRRPLNGAFTGSLVTAKVTGSLRPTFEWDRPDEAACGGASYEIQIDDSCPVEGSSACAFPSPEVHEITLDPTFRPDEDLPVSSMVPVGTRYFWRVRACDVLERCSDWSLVRYLDVGRDRQDVTGDGYPDIVVQDRTDWPDAYLFYAGAPELGEADVLGFEPDRVFEEMGTSGLFWDVNPPVVRFVGDVNGDGFQDFVADGPPVNAYNEVDQTQTPPPRIDCPTRLLYLGAADSADIEPILFSTSSWAPISLAHNFGAGDFDGDGYADIWAAQSLWSVAESEVNPAYEPRVFLFRGRPDVASLPAPANDGGPSDFSGVYSPSAFIAPRPDDNGDLLGVSVEPGDFDGDGLIDAALVAPYERFVYILSGGGADFVVDRAIPYGGLDAQLYDCRNARLSVGDFNGDRADDFAINCPELDLVEVYFGGDPLPDAMALSYSLEPHTPGGVVDTLAADFDGDGLFDLATGSPSGYLGTSSASLWLLLGSDLLATEPPPSTLPVWPGPGYLGAADHNGDGHTDLVVAGDPAGWIPGAGTLDFSGADGAATAPRKLLRDGQPMTTLTVGR